MVDAIHYNNKNIKTTTETPGILKTTYNNITHPHSRVQNSSLTFSKCLQEKSQLFKAFQKTRRKGLDLREKGFPQSRNCYGENPLPRSHKINHGLNIPEANNLHSLTWSSIIRTGVRV